jgi:hypothetical protein
MIGSGKARKKPFIEEELYNFFAIISCGRGNKQYFLLLSL